MGDVVVMSPERNQKHLDKILDKLASAYMLRAKCVSGSVKIISVDKANEIIERLHLQYDLYKEEYDL